MNKQILSEEEINKIVNQAYQKRYMATTSSQVVQALIGMLKIFHLFKSELDRKSILIQTLETLQEEAEYFCDAVGWKGVNRWENGINLDDLLLFKIDVEKLLFQTLYALNGSDYHITEHLYDLEGLFDMIFMSVPKGKEFDIEIIRFLLLPIYNSTHNADYQMTEVFQASCKSFLH